MLVGISYDETYGASRRFAFKHAAEQFHMVGFIASCSYSALSRSPSIELALDEVYVNIYTCGHAVYHSAYSLSVAFTECGQCEYVTVCVSHINGVHIHIRNVRPRDDGDDYGGHDRSHRRIFPCRIRSHHTHIRILHRLNGLSCLESLRWWPHGFL